MRTLRVEIDVPNPGAKLQPGLYVYATVIAEEHPEVRTLPVTAIVSEPGKDYCVAIVAGKAARRPIRIGLSDGIRTEVVSGLDGREVVVKANAASLMDGQLVEIVDPANPSPSARNLDDYADYQDQERDITAVTGRSKPRRSRSR